jgi:hypothetical protein
MWTQGTPSCNSVRVQALENQRRNGVTENLRKWGPTDSKALEPGALMSKGRKRRDIRRE